MLLLISMNGSLFSNSAKQELLKTLGLVGIFQKAATMKKHNPSYVITKTNIHQIKPELFESQKALDAACSSTWNYLREYRESFRQPLPEFENLLDQITDINTASLALNELNSTQNYHQNERYACSSGG